MKHASNDLSPLFDFFGCGYYDVLTRRKVSQRAPDFNSGSPFVGYLRQHDKQVNVAPLGGSSPRLRTEKDYAQRSKATNDAVYHG